MHTEGLRFELNLGSIDGNHFTLQCHLQCPLATSSGSWITAPFSSERLKNHHDCRLGQEGFERNPDAITFSDLEKGSFVEEAKTTKMICRSILATTSATASHILGLATAIL